VDTWISDDNGNRCSVEHFGSEKVAKAALESLKDCRNCTNCNYCTNCDYCNYCNYCEGCEGCEYCTGCKYCVHCTNCTDCRNVMRVKNPQVVGPVRSDGYQFVIGETGSIHAGCRVFATADEAREHWKKTRGGTSLGEESLAIIDFLERMASIMDANK
jgi:hypothetical protein